MKLNRQKFRDQLDSCRCTDGEEVANDSNDDVLHQAAYGTEATLLVEIIRQAHCHPDHHDWSYTSIMKLSTSPRNALIILGAGALVYIGSKVLQILVGGMRNPAVWL